MKMDLDVDAPEKVARVLAEAAQAYYESASEVDAAWQGSGPGSPGKIWEQLARILDKAAQQCENKIKERGY